MDEILDGLNEAQREAAECLGGPVLILAGAGSGKTRTLTCRIANLIEHGVEPYRILAVTFTNKAAREMRERLWRLLQGHLGDDAEVPRSFMPYMGTFHGMCVKILRMEADAAGLDRNFVIYDADDQLALMKRIMKESQLNNDKMLKPKSVQGVISSEKNQGNGPEEYAVKAFYANQKAIAKVFEKYEEEKRKAGALDFDDLLLKTLEMFSHNEAVRQRWQERFQHILIDEYQDTNAVQYQLVKLLVGQERNICVVGDDWQSIYSWRGADFTNILNFERDYPGAKVVKLERNYRSTGNILNAAQKIILKNKTRTDKELYTEMGDGKPVEIENLADEGAEAEFVVRKILELSREYKDFSNFAVLYRTNAQSYAFEKAMLTRQIPYKIVGGVRFYDRKEVKDVLAILKLAISGRDKVSLERVAKNVLSGIGEVSLRKVLDAMDATQGDDPLLAPDFAEVLNATRARNGMAQLTSFLAKVNAQSNPGEAVKKTVEHFDFKKLLDDGTPTGDERMKNLEVLAGIAAEYETLEEFLVDAALMSSADETSGRNSVTLMTLHAAKGLEFPVVFVVGLEEGLFPTGRAYDKEDDLEEERRLMYVGMTRAMQRLFLTYASSRYSFGNRSYNMPSRFLTDLGYNPRESKGSLGYMDEDGDGFTDFSETDFDPFPDDLPIWE